MDDAEFLANVVKQWIPGYAIETRRRLNAIAKRIDGPHLDAFDDHDLCDAWAGLPVEFFAGQA